MHEWASGLAGPLFLAMKLSLGLYWQTLAKDTDVNTISALASLPGYSRNGLAAFVSSNCIYGCDVMATGIFHSRLE